MKKNNLHTSKLCQTLLTTTTLISVALFSQNVVEAEGNSSEIDVYEENINKDSELIEEVQSDEKSELTDEEIDKQVNSDENSPSSESNLESEESAINSSPNPEENVFSLEEVREVSISSITSSVKPQYTTDFINSISNIAVELGSQYGLYPSIIIAQSALESGWGGQSSALEDDYQLSLPPNYNLFGVKGSYNGQSVLVTTEEFDKDLNDFIEVKEYFKKYPSYEESILDYVSKMKYNTTTKDPYYYSGVWRENTTSYKDATAFLTGRYATDPEYGNKLNTIIEEYDLTKYDNLMDSDNGTVEENIVDRYTVAYNATILKSDLNIYNIPGSNNSNDVVANSSTYAGKNLVIKEEAVTNNDVYAQLEINGKVIGWIDKEGIKEVYYATLETSKVAYNAEISNTNMGIYSTPAWTKGNKLVAQSSDYVGKNLVIKEEIVTEEATYVKVEVNGKVIGWINRGGIKGHYNTAIETNQVAYNAEISNTNMGIYSTPAWTKGNKLVAQSSDYVGKNLVIKEEIVTEEATYAKVEVNGKVIGWINKGGLRENYNTVLETSQVAYNAEISNTNMGIYSTPAWTKGNKLVAQSSDYVGKNLVIKEEIVTEEATYAKVEVNGKVIGWINKGGLRENYNTVLETSQVAYNAEISNTNMGIYSTPAWTKGNKLVAQSSEYAGENLVVKEEIVTEEATYAKVEVDGKVIGWINKGGIKGKYYTYLENNNTSYGAKFISSNSNIFNKPAWTEGNRLVEKSSNFKGETFIVEQEIVTEEARYALVTINEKVIGWVNTNAIERVPIVYLDAGHGGIDNGASSGGVIEKELNLSISNKVYKILEDMGYLVKVSRDTDETLTLSQRAQEANNMNADIFVSIHHNAFDGVSQGIETYYYNGSGNTSNELANDPERLNDSKEMAENIQKELISETGAYDRGVKKANFHVVRETEMPAVLIEGGFIDNTIERAKLKLAEYQNKLAKAIATGIDKFLGSWFN